MDDKQVLSLESQLTELRSLARSEGLKIVTEFTEKRTAKFPDCPILDEVVERVHRGEAHATICWKLDRSACNSGNDGLVSWSLQQATTQRIATPERSYCPADNVLLMSVEFDMAN